MGIRGVSLWPWALPVGKPGTRTTESCVIQFLPIVCCFGFKIKPGDRRKMILIFKLALFRDLVQFPTKRQGHWSPAQSDGFPLANRVPMDLCQANHEKKFYQVLIAPPKGFLWGSRGRGEGKMEQEILILLVLFWIRSCNINPVWPFQWCQCLLENYPVLPYDVGIYSLVNKTDKDLILEPERWSHTWSACHGNRRLT